MKDSFFCPTLARRIEMKECDSRVEDGSCAGDCEVRKYWLAYEEPEAEPELRKCASCSKKKPLTAEYFNMRRDGRDFKKTCRACDERYWPAKKNPKRSGRKPKRNKTQSDAIQTQCVPAPPPEGTGIDLSEFKFIQNNSRRPTAPLVSVNAYNLAFNAEAGRQFKGVLSGCQTVDVGIKNGGDTLQILFVPRADMSGQYRIQTDPEYKINIALDKKGYPVGKGPWPVREVDGVLLAEVAG